MVISYIASVTEISNTGAASMSTDSKFLFVSAKWSEDIGAYVASINGKVAIIDIEPKGAKAVAP